MMMMSAQQQQPAYHTNGFGKPCTLRVHFNAYSKTTERVHGFSEVHASIADARLRAAAMGWTIQRVEDLTLTNCETSA